MLGLKDGRFSFFLSILAIIETHFFPQLYSSLLGGLERIQMAVLLSEAYREHSVVIDLWKFHIEQCLKSSQSWGV
jgi:hypothetical protein